MFAGCIKKDEYTKVSEITTSPASTPIILPTSTPTGDAIELVGAFYAIREKYSCQACDGDIVFGENIACSVCSGTGMVNLKNPLFPREFQADYFTGVKKVQKV